jgi:AGCS family alanine or glycine:cation symporter
LALMFFAFTTIVAYYYMAETNIQYINRKLHRPWTLHALKIAMIGSTALGAIRSADTAWALGDLGVGLMAWLNIIAIVILQRPALVALKDYERQKRSGDKPVFNPAALGIRHAELWHGVEAPEEAGDRARVAR